MRRTSIKDVRPYYMCYAPVQIWMPQLLRYGGVASRVAVRARTQLLKEADPGSNPAERGWSHLWCPRAAHAGEPFLLPGFAQEQSTAAAGAAGDQGVRVENYSGRSTSIDSYRVAS